MALIPSESPNILVKEFDLSGVVPAVTTSTGAFVGDFNWGPVDQPRLVGNEAELVSAFGSPDTDSAADATDFLSASMFLKYSGSAYVSRAVGDAAKNAAAAGTAPLVKNLDNWNAQSLTANITANKLVAKYPGTLGNSIKVSICPRSDSDAAFTNWTVDGVNMTALFDGAPATSSYVSSLSSATAYDEAHVVVYDNDGKVSGTPGTILETFPYVSLATDAKKDDGSTNYILDVLNNQSSYVWGASLAADFTGITNAAAFTGAGDSAVQTYAFSGGVHDALDVGDYRTGFDQYDDPDNIQVDFLIAPGLQADADQRTLINYLATIASTQRKDCVVVASPSRNLVVNTGNNSSTIASDTATWANTLNASSYIILDNNYLKVYDKYRDKYVFIPAAPATAGIMAAADVNSAPWFSPAGQRRGQYFGVTSLAYNPSKSQRDTLYKAAVNPIVNLPGQGILLFGDKTKLGRPSAFDRINVRRLFLVMERAIKGAAQNVMFEFNDEFTRAEFVNIVEPFLREIKGRRGITDFRVVCDETNNTPDIIDNNQFVASVFVKPARSINYVTLNFVAVRTGVDFDEVVGLV